MEENKFTESPHTDIQQNMDATNRRAEERRADACEGFTYVSTVGWICRREKSRRKNHDKAPSQSPEF